MNLKDKGTTLILSGVIAASVAVGAVGGTMLSALGTHAQTPTSTPAAAPSTRGNPGRHGGNAGAAGGTFKSNEDPTHEAHESPQREAQEDAGQRPTVP